MLSERGGAANEYQHQSVPSHVVPISQELGLDSQNRIIRKNCNLTCEASLLVASPFAIGELTTYFRFIACR